ncbi:MAG: DUF3343 domain-containing protein [Oscillospiraceae bacterium]|nr:DUF3343 domain-containing protein [Oscillospiraceae bacterium]
MYDMYLTVRSVTRGQKGRDVLSRAGLRCALVRAPRAIAPGGCAYALALRRGDEARALRLLERAGVPVEGCWISGADGRFERVGP